MHKVTRSLPLLLGGFGSVIAEVITGDGTFVQGCQGNVLLVGTATHAVLVAGIDEATANAGLHIDEVQLNNTCDETPVFFVEVITCTFLGSQFQIDSRGQCHLVMAVTVVATAVVHEGFLPIIIGVSSIIIMISTTGDANVCLVFTCIVIVRRTFIAMTYTCPTVTEVEVAGQRAQVVHDVVDAKVVAVLVSFSA